MTSDKLKEQFVQEVATTCMKWMPPEEVDRVRAALHLALHKVTLSREETALSTDFARPNEWYVQQWLAIKMIGGRSQKTLKYYGATAKKFLQIVTKPIPQITATDIRYYLACRSQEGISKATVNNELRNLRSLFQTLVVEELVARNPTAKIEQIKVRKEVKQPFTELEMEKLRKACFNKFGLNKKHLAIIEVLYSTGCRVGELSGMNKSDLHGDQIKVLGKGDKERIVYLNPRAQIALEDYLASRGDSEPALFPGYDIRKKEVTARMDISSIESIVRGIGKRAGVENVHPHRFRRTAATVALRRGMPIEQVSKMLGHEQITTTQIYASVSEDDLHRSHQKYLT